MEFQIPIPALASDPTQPDYSIVQRAWWDIINLCYEDDDTPMRLTLELRIMGDSNIIMAPQNGNTFGTASIEVISIPHFGVLSILHFEILSILHFEILSIQHFGILRK